MSNHQEDLSLLLSLQDKFLETPPGSPSNPGSSSPGYLSDDGSPRQRGQVDMSAFRNIVQDCLDYEPKPVDKIKKPKLSKKSNDPEVENFSGLRIRNLLLGDTLSGCWATVAVLTEKGHPKTSSIGQNYCIWKLGCLEENTISVFLFGDAYQKNWKEHAGTVFALFNCSVRKDAKGPGFSLSVSSASQIIKMGTSVDYGVCIGKRKDGMACNTVINKRKGIYCGYHRLKASDRFITTRSELKGGNLRTAFRSPLNSEGIYLFDPLTDRTNLQKPKQPVKVLSVEGLKKALSNAGKVTTNTHSQGIRFLNEMAGPKTGNRESIKPGRQSTNLEKRKSPTVKPDPSLVTNQQADDKRRKTDQGQALADKTQKGTGKMIELDMFKIGGEVLIFSLQKTHPIVNCNGQQIDSAALQNFARL
ncbi:zf-primase domain-containing protein [Citrus sinensis]|uniref:Zf-primase domain-containing protein n=1 Tax=Citrus sinensis TaxID=2711 RepID=A0ACB8ICH8_CITSI|nr:zf-primase domain-containing protein [Citrus sinensis]